MSVTACSSFQLYTPTLTYGSARVGWEGRRLVLTVSNQGAARASQCPTACAVCSYAYSGCCAQPLMSLFQNQTGVATWDCGEIAVVALGQSKAALSGRLTVCCVDVIGGYLVVMHMVGKPSSMAKSRLEHSM